MSKINVDMLARFYSLQELKKEIEQELGQLKDKLNDYFDESVGENRAGEIEQEGYVLKRQIRKTEKFDEERAVKRLEELQMADLIETVKRPDKNKVHAAVELGLLRAEQVEDLTVRQYSRVLVVKKN